jgi:hypothetical protein
MDERLKIYEENTNKKLPLNKFIIPFAYDNAKCYKKTVTDVINNSTGAEWQYSSLIGSDHEFYEHISNLIGTITAPCEADGLTSGRVGAIGDCLEIKQLSSGIPFLDKRVRIEIRENKKIIGTFCFNKIQMVLFQTNIGFLILDADYPKGITLDQMTRMNFILKGIKNRKIEYRYLKDQELTLDASDICDVPFEGDSGIAVEYNRSVKYIERSKISFSEDYAGGEDDKVQLIDYHNGRYGLKYKAYCHFTDFLDCILENVPITTYFNNTYDKEKDKIYPHKAHVFASVLLDQIEDVREAETAFFSLRKGYKDSYLPDETEFDFADNDEIYKPFSNSYWGVSREGMANLCYLTGNKTTDAFFKSNYAERLDNYLYLYLLVLHQHYGLLNLTGRIAYLDIEAKKCSDNKKEYHTILQLRDDITFFYLKCVYEAISHISHQEKLYTMVVETLGVKKMMEELHFEMDRIVGIISQIRDEKKNKNLRLITIAGALFTVVQVYDAVLEIDSAVVLNNKLAVGEILHAGGVLLVIFLIGIMIWFLWRAGDSD